MYMLAYLPYWLLTSITGVLCFNWQVQQTALEAVAPTYLSPTELPQFRLDRYRYRAGR